ncbi:MAG: glycosyl hydrolase-related protein [Planctomycetota bacterium]|jgi:hypothetical protein
MSRLAWPVILCAAVGLVAEALGQSPGEDDRWTVYVTNDNCPDYTWGYTEEQTRQAFADIVKEHLDEMKRTDRQPPESRNRYNMAVTQEALCFAERYPGRKEELIRRIRQGRVFVSPYLCNTLWAFQSAEGTIRAFYPARRLEQQWGISIKHAHHIELPSLPWGTASILAGCGFRSLSIPYLSYDCTFGGLKNPPLFFHEGPDGSRVKVWLDRWASSKSNYTQGAAVLRNPDSIKNDWLPHYAKLGEVYPLRAILSSGTHGDISPHSGNQARGFAEAIAKYNARAERSATLVNAIFPQFWKTVEEAQSQSPFLPTIRGSFGHSWDLWPVCLAKYAADMRQAERTFLAAETLLALAGSGEPAMQKSTRVARRRAEWCWAMLADHAWNGNSEPNRRHNAELRRRWSERFGRMARELLQQGWAAAGLQFDQRSVSLLNSLSFPRRGIVRIEVPAEVSYVTDGQTRVATQIVREGDQRQLCFVAPEIPGFAFRQVRLDTDKPAELPKPVLQASPMALESPYYRLTVDPKTGGIASLVHKATGIDLVNASHGRSVLQTVHFDGTKHILSRLESKVVAVGPVLARLQITGSTSEVQVANFVTVYAELDRVDFDLRVTKKPGTKEERLCHLLPVLPDDATLRVATAGAVVRPRPQPAGDLLPGADTRRFAVQEFINLATDEVQVTVVSRDAFALWLDLAPICFEALGNDQNHREVLKDQNGVTEFRFRYSLQAKAGGYHRPDAIRFSRDAATDLLAVLGRAPDATVHRRPPVTADPKRAVATCLKPADDDSPGGVILRLWETAGQSEPLSIGVTGFSRAVETDLLERDRKAIEVINGKINLPLKAHGYAAVRLVP